MRHFRKWMINRNNRHRHNSSCASFLHYSAEAMPHVWAMKIVY